MNWCDVNIYATVVQCIAGSSLGPLRNKSIYLRSIAQIMTHRFLLTGPMASVFFSTSKRRVRLHCGKEVAMVPCLRWLHSGRGKDVGNLLIKQHDHYSYLRNRSQIVSPSNPTNSPVEKMRDIVPGIYRIEHASNPNCVVDLFGPDDKTIIGRLNNTRCPSYHTYLEAIFRAPPTWRGKSTGMEIPCILLRGTLNGVVNSGKSLRRELVTQ